MAEFDLRSGASELISLCRKVVAHGCNIAVTGHDSPDADSIISAVMMRKLLEKFNIACRIKFGSEPDGVTRRDMDLLGLLDGVDFGGFDAEDRLLLVDHHKSFYAFPTIACVDHHTTSPEPEGEVAIVVSASSCGRVIYDMAVSLGVSDGELERLAIYSVYLDTQSCQSPKFKKSDVEWLERGIEKYGIDKAWLTRMGYVLCDASEDIGVLAMYGYKKYSFGERPSFSTCVQIDAQDDAWGDVIEKIVAYLKVKICDDGGAVWAFVVNMPIEARSDIYFIDRLGGVEVVELDRLASRSRDVIPIVSIAE